MNTVITPAPYARTNVHEVAALVGRILLAAIFIKSGFGKITGFEGTVGYIASKGLPLPQIGAIIAILVELGGGILLAIGFKARWAALAIAIFTLAAGDAMKLWGGDNKVRIDQARASEILIFDLP